MLEDLSVLSVTSNIGNADSISSNQVVSLHDVLRFSHQYLGYLFVVLRPSIQFLYIGLKEVISLPKALYVILCEIVVLNFGRRACLQDRNEDIAEIRGHKGCCIVNISHE